MKGDPMSAGAWIMVAALALIGLVCCVAPSVLMIIGFLADATSR